MLFDSESEDEESMSRAVETAQAARFVLCAAALLIPAGFLVALLPNKHGARWKLPLRLLCCAVSLLMLALNSFAWRAQRAGAKEGEPLHAVTAALSYAVLGCSALLFVVLAGCFLVFVVFRGAHLERLAEARAHAAEREAVVVQLSREILAESTLRRLFEAWRDAHRSGALAPTEDEEEMKLAAKISFWSGASGAAAPRGGGPVRWTKQSAAAKRRGGRASQHGIEMRESPLRGAGKEAGDARIAGGVNGMSELDARRDSADARTIVEREAREGEKERQARVYEQRRARLQAERARGGAGAAGSNPMALAHTMSALDVRGGANPMARGAGLRTQMSSFDMSSPAEGRSSRGGLSHTMSALDVRGGANPMARGAGLRTQMSSFDMSSPMARPQDADAESAIAAGTNAMLGARRESAEARAVAERRARVGEKERQARLLEQKRSFLMQSPLAAGALPTGGPTRGGFSGSNEMGRADAAAAAARGGAFSSLNHMELTRKGSSGPAGFGAGAAPIAGSNAALRAAERPACVDGAAVAGGRNPMQSAASRTISGRQLQPPSAHARRSVVKPIGANPMHLKKKHPGRVSVIAAAAPLDMVRGGINPMLSAASRAIPGTSAAALNLGAAGVASPMQPQHGRASVAKPISGGANPMLRAAAATQPAARPSHDFSGSNPAQPAAQGAKRASRAMRKSWAKAHSPEGTGTSSPRSAARSTAPARSPLAPRAQCAHRATTVSSVPPVLPSLNSSHTVYYYNKMSHETSWVKPVDMLAPTAEATTPALAAAASDSDSAPY